MNDRLSLADQALVNVAALSLIEPSRGAADLARDIEEMALLLPRVGTESLRMRDVAEAAQALVASHPLRLAGPERAQPWHRARFDLRMALAAVFRMRAAGAIDRLRNAEAVT